MNRKTDTGKNLNLWPVFVDHFKNDIYNDARAIVPGQNFRPPFICYQVASHKYYGLAIPTIALAQRDATQQFNDIHIATPAYILKPAHDNLHLTAEGSWLLGAYAGKVYHKIYNLGELWTGLTIDCVTVQGRVMQVHMNVPSPPLVIDTLSNPVAATKDSGFSIRTNNHLTRHDIIESVSISSATTINIKLSTDLPVGAYLCYAFGESSDINGSNPITGPRGNIRDSAGLTDIAVDPAGIEHPLHNWMLISDYKLEVV